MQRSLILAALLSVAAVAQERQHINVGTPGSGTGDPLRDGFLKVNTNFWQTWQTWTNVPYLVLWDTNSPLQNSFSLLQGTNVTFRVDGRNVYVDSAASGDAVNLESGTVGNLPVTRLADGTGAGATTFWRGDGAWATPPGDGAGAGDALLDGTNMWTGTNIFSGTFALPGSFDVGQVQAGTILVSNAPPSRLAYFGAESILDYLNVGTGLAISGGALTATGAGAGTVVGPVSSTTNAVALWSGVDGDTLTDSSFLVDTNGHLAGPGFRSTGTGINEFDNVTVTDLTPSSAVFSGVSKQLVSIATIGASGNVPRVTGTPTHGQVPAYKSDDTTIEWVDMADITGADIGTVSTVTTANDTPTAIYTTTLGTNATLTAIAEIHAAGTTNSAYFEMRRTWRRTADGNITAVGDETTNAVHRSEASLAANWSQANPGTVSLNVTGFGDERLAWWSYVKTRLLANSAPPEEPAGGACTTAEESFTTASNGYSSFGQGPNQMYIAQKFTTVNAGTRCGFRAYLEKVGTPAYNVDWARIYSHDAVNDTPDAGIGTASAGYALSGLAAIETAVDFTISAAVDSSTIYWLVIKLTGTENLSNSVRWHRASQVLSNSILNSADGATWVNVSSSRSSRFELFSPDL